MDAELPLLPSAHPVPQLNAGRLPFGFLQNQHKADTVKHACKEASTAKLHLKSKTLLFRVTVLLQEPGHLQLGE